MPASRPLAALLALGLAAPAAAQVDGISYAFSPVATYAFYDGNAALRSHLLYGGRLGFGFGRYVELDAEYLRGARTRTTFDGFEAPTGVDALLQALPAQDVDVQRAGAGLRVNVGRWRLLPFLRGGAGIVQIDPEDVDATRSIYVTYGGGLTLSAAQRYTLTVEGARDVYRYSPFATYALGDGGPFTPDDFPVRTVHNLALSASLRLYLGGRTEGSETDVDAALRRQFAGGGLRLFVEPAYGQIAFNSRLGASFPEKQPVAGLSAGFDLGPYVGLRGAYLRATDEDTPLADGVPTSFRDLSLYGGELNLRFAQAAGGLTPYVILGGGYLNAGEDYDAGALGRPSDRPFAQIGAGLDLPLTPAVRLKGAIRSLLMSDLDADAVATPSRVYGSALWTGGVEVSLGRRGRSVASVLDRSVEARLADERARAAQEQAAREQALREAVRAAYHAQLRTEVDSLRLAVTAAPNDSVRTERLAALAVREAALADTLAAGAAPAGVANVSGRTMTIPVPERGEIYIRYGDPVAPETQVATPIVVTTEGLAAGTGSATEAQVAALVRAELARQQGQALTRAEVDRIVRAAVQSAQASNAALLARLATLEARLAAAPLAGPSAVVAVDSSGAVLARNADAGLLWGRQYYSTLPFLGVRTGSGPTQALVGIRGDFRLPSGAGMRFLPEVGIGVGDGVSLQAFANTAWGLPRVSGLEPYAGLGAGVKTDKGFTGAGLAINLLAGFEVPFANGRGFVEYSTLDFFDIHRGLVGYRLLF